MKAIHIILNIIITIAFLSFGNLTECQGQRNTLWLRGTTINSNGWGAMKAEMSAKGFQFNDLSNSFFDPSLGIVGAADQVEDMVGSNENVLGIAHDYGGIVLRDLQLQDPSITAMILDGVPNQGSSGIRGAIESDIPGNSRAEKLVDAVNLIRQGDDCNNCGFIQAFESWIEDMQAGAEFLDDVQQDSPIINNLGEPTVPFAILWGSIDELSLTSLMSSRAFPSDSDHFSRCFTATLNREREEAKDQTTRSLINNTQGFFGNVLSAATSIITAAGTSGPAGTLGIISEIGSFLSSSRDRITNSIAAVQEEDAELARILRCELSSQYLAAEWQLLILENSERAEVEVEVSTRGDAYRECVQECGIDMAWGDWDSNLTCDEACQDQMGTGTEIRTVILEDPNDGLLTESEQKLEGYADMFHLARTNHFQETSASNDDAVNALNDLFLGGAGAAFMVPK